MNGSHIGQVCHIPRIDLISQEGTLPIILKRRQFPVMLAFAMTINKSQGQSMLYLGIFLPDPVFGHGQLYVALSYFEEHLPSPIKPLVTAPNEHAQNGAAESLVKYFKNGIMKQLHTADLSMQW